MVVVMCPAGCCCSCRVCMGHWSCDVSQAQQCARSRDCVHVGSGVPSDEQCALRLCRWRYARVASVGVVAGCVDCELKLCFIWCACEVVNHDNLQQQQHHNTCKPTPSALLLAKPPSTRPVVRRRHQACPLHIGRDTDRARVRGGYEPGGDDERERRAEGDDDGLELWGVLDPSVHEPLLCLAGVAHGAGRVEL